MLQCTSSYASAEFDIPYCTAKSTYYSDWMCSLDELEGTRAQFFTIDDKAPKLCVVSTVFLISFESCVGHIKQHERKTSLMYCVIIALLYVSAKCECLFCYQIIKLRLTVLYNDPRFGCALQDSCCVN